MFKYESSPFPLDSKFEYEIFSALLMTDEELAQTGIKLKVGINNGEGLFNIYQYGVDNTLVMW